MGFVTDSAIQMNGLSITMQRMPSSSPVMTGGRFGPRRLRFDAPLVMIARVESSESESSEVVRLIVLPSLP